MKSSLHSLIPFLPFLLNYFANSGDSLNSLLHCQLRNSILILEKEGEIELLYDWRLTANHFILGTNPLRPTTSNLFFQLNTWGYSPHVTYSLTRGWVWRLQLVLALASAAILRSVSRGTHNHILLSQIRDSPNLEGQVPVFILPGTG
jgi:hypothetical protein